MTSFQKFLLSTFFKDQRIFTLPPPVTDGKIVSVFTLREQFEDFFNYWNVPVFDNWGRIKDKEYKVYSIEQVQAVHDQTKDQKRNPDPNDFFDSDCDDISIDRIWAIAGTLARCPVIPVTGDWKMQSGESNSHEFVIVLCSDGVWVPEEDIRDDYYAVTISRGI